jgi:hypothetical protein
VSEIDEKVELKIDLAKAANKISAQFERNIDTLINAPA